ncbi:hypothetical protein BCR44DRAFT_1495134 [Catenaria anguillulae PL171]|uniref:Uncharacterized protein n=1 Tax=Catenaria anguillulae PL171 TaxID=765915 RepID=A0A1Y2I842_9FUNG|nr:hypothetical protein BCR44DRAFT_1495134 [Catenaria anguillulae PL171]
MKSTTSTPFDLIPAELWHQALCLSRPSAHIAAASRLTSEALQDGEPARLSWTFRIIFHSPLLPLYRRVDPPAFDHQTGREIRMYYPSRLAQYLFHQLPGKSTRDTPTRDTQHLFVSGAISPTTIDGSLATHSLLTPGLIDWLFCPNGPLARRRPKTVDGLATQLKCVLMPLMPLMPLPAPDYCFLLVYFVRSGQLVQLSSMLSHLTHLFPQLDQLVLPFCLWATTTLDRSCELFPLHRDHPLSTRVSLPVFLASMALIDWSVPTLDVVFDRFPNVSRGDFLKQFFSLRPLVHRFKQMLARCEPVSRITQVLDWILANQGIDDGVRSNLFPVSVLLDGAYLPYPTFLTLLSKYESTVARWLINDENEIKEALMSLVLEHDLVTLKQAELILKWATCFGTDGARDLIGGKMAKNGRLLDLYIEAFVRGTTKNKNLDTDWLYHLHDYLVKYDGAPTTRLLQHLPRLDCCKLAQILFPTDTRLQSIPWDFGKVLFSWAAGDLPLACHEIHSPNHTTLLSNILDQAFASPSSASLDRFSQSIPTNVYVQLLAARTINLVQDGRFRANAAAACRSIGHLTALLNRRCHGHRLFSETHLSPALVKRFRHCIALSMSHWLPAAYSTALDPSADAARFVAYHVASLDLKFVKSSVRWDKHVAPWVWHWFSQPELDKLMVSVSGVCDAFERMQQADRSEDEVVPELAWMLSRVPHRVLKAPEFWKTIGSLVHKYPSFEADNE